MNANQHVLIEGNKTLDLRATEYYLKYDDPKQKIPSLWNQISHLTQDNYLVLMNGDKVLRQDTTYNGKMVYLLNSFDKLIRFKIPNVVQVPPPMKLVTPKFNISAPVQPPIKKLTGLNVQTIPEKSKEIVDKMVASLTIPYVEPEYPNYDIRDTTYYYGDFCNEFTGKDFSQDPNNYQRLTKQLRRVVKGVYGQKIVFMKQSRDNPFVIIKDPYNHIDSTRFYKSGTVQVKDGIMKIVESKVMSPLINCEDSLFVKEVIWKPFHYDQPLPESDKRLNTFSGFQAKLVYHDMKIIQPILDHIFEVWANNNMDHYKYILSHLSIGIRTLELAGVALVLIGPQGTGKSMILDHLFGKYIYGKNLTLSLAGIDKISQRFNGALKGKMFIIMNEAESTESQSNYLGKFDNLKHIIADDIISLEPKGGEVFSTENCNSLYICSQHLSSIHIEGTDDRRYAMFDVSPKYKNNFAYFEQLAKHINQETGDHLYSYFRSEEFANTIVVDIKVLPQTEIRKTLAKHKTPPVTAFFDELFADTNKEDFGFFDDQIAIINSTVRVQTDDIYQLYVTWTKAQGILKIKDKPIFSRDIKCPMLQHLDSPFKHKGLTRKGFIIKPEAYDRCLICRGQTFMTLTEWLKIPK